MVKSIIVFIKILFIFFKYQDALLFCPRIDRYLWNFANFSHKLIRIIVSLLCPHDIHPFFLHNKLEFICIPKIQIPNEEIRFQHKTETNTHYSCSTKDVNNTEGRLLLLILSVGEWDLNNWLMRLINELWLILG